jgi:hypothetical protein
MKRTIQQSSLLLLISILFVCSKCKKDDIIPTDNPYGLPNATQTGVNTFACRVNAQNWVSEPGIYKTGGSFNTDTLGCFGTVNGNIIRLFIGGNTVQAGQYVLGVASNRYIRYSTFATCTGNLPVILLRDAVSGTVTITKIDTVKKIIAGTFNCRIPIPNCDTLNVTDGRFDIGY